MTTVAFLTRLRERGIHLRVDGDKLKITGPKQALTTDLRSELERRRDEVFEFLSRAAAESGEVVKIGAAPAGVPHPLSFAQQRMWFLAQVDAIAAAYNMQLLLRLRGELDVSALAWAIEQIVRRHDSLRLQIHDADGQPTQTVAESMPCELRRVDLVGHSRLQQEVLRLAHADADEVFDYSIGPLYRFLLVHVGPQEHVFAITMAHVITDGWSFGVFCEELAHFYAARLRGEEPTLPALSIQYPDYACWQHQWYRSETARRQLEYWRKQLAGLPTLDLPTDRQRPAVQSFRGTIRRFAIPKQLAEDLRALSRKHDCTFFMVALAAFKVLLARYSRQEDIVIGTPVANRPARELEPMIGLFLNNLVLRTDLSGEPTFVELLGRVREMALAAFQNREIPFEKLVVELRPARDLSRNPMFQVLFNLLNEPSAPLALPGVEASAMDLDIVSAKFDLTLGLEDVGDGLVGMLEYNQHLFDAVTAARMARHYLRILEEIVRDPSRSIWNLPILGEEERRDLLVAPNQNGRDYPRDRCLHQLVAEHARSMPDAVAVVAGGESLTYGELERRANQLAHHLIARGVQPESLVGISVSRNVSMVVGLFGILKAGAAYVPLDPAYPVDRLAFVIEDAGIELLLTEVGLQSSLPEKLPEVVLLDADAQAIAANPIDAPALRFHADQLAYVIFTSGSTGRPKGVQIEHRALVNFLSGMAERPGLKKDDVLVAVTTISFDIAGLELYLPLSVGAQVVIAVGGVEADGRRLAELIGSSGCTIMQATPATWQLLIDSGWRGDPRLKVLCGGEALPRDLAEQLLQCCGDLWNVYGPTETTIWSLAHRVTSGEGPVSIGGPIANTEIYVLDRYRNPVPVGVPGELFIGGDGLARGYWRRPELTAKRFVQHPFRADARIYDTGDLVRWNNDGTLEYLGRVDQQVKIRGFRIELAEIEHVLGQHEAVKECAVVARTRHSGDKHLAAYLTFHPGGSATVSELRTQLRSQVPDYMVPPGFVMLDDLPRTPNGKIDRKALVNVESRVMGVDQYEPPRTATEVFIAEIWQELLEIDSVSRNDRFFDLGGHSLLAMKVVFRVEKEIGQRLLPMELLLNTLEQFAEMCDQRRTRLPRDGGRGVAKTVDPAPRGPEQARQGSSDGAQGTRAAGVRKEPAVRETAILFGEPRTLVGVMTEPGEGYPCNGIACLLLNAGFTYRAGPQRMYVKLARRLAAAGFLCLRFDYSSIGDSLNRGDHLSFAQRSISEAKEAMDFLAAARDVQKFVTIGLCWGADNALRTCCVDPRVIGAGMIDFYAMPSLRYLTRLYCRRLLSARSWRQLLRGESRVFRYGRELVVNTYKRLIRRQKSDGLADEIMPFQPPSAIIADMRKAAERGAQLCFVYVRGGPSYDHYLMRFRRPMAELQSMGRVRVEYLGDADHVFTLLHSQHRLVESLAAWAGDLAAEHGEVRPVEEVASLSK